MRLVIFFAGAFAFFSLSAFDIPTAPTTHITARQSDEIISRIVNKYSKMYQKYAGVEYDRHVTIDWYYSDGKSVAKREKVIYHRVNPFYDHITYKTLLYEVDGKPAPLDDYDTHEDMPGIPPFDINGGKEYKRTVEAVELARGQLCYRVFVVPRHPQQRHFKGRIWVSVDNLEMLVWEGTAGKMRFGAKRLYVKFYSQDFGDYFSFTSGYTKATINVLGLYKRILVFNFVNKHIKPLYKHGGK